MIRKIIKIDEEKCNGCGLCASACLEGAIVMADGKAKLVRDDYCDGLGNCLPVCPTGAISFEEREALPFDEQAVHEAMMAAEQGAVKATEPEEVSACSCPGGEPKTLKQASFCGCEGEIAQQSGDSHQPSAVVEQPVSELMQWPVQIKLLPIKAPYYENADLLIAADCAAYAFAGFHQKFMKGRITLIGCPKLDDGDYTEKLTEIIKQNNIRSVKIIRMEVPCCGGLDRAVRQALINSGKMIPWQVVVIASDGRVISE